MTKINGSAKRVEGQYQYILVNLDKINRTSMLKFKSHQPGGEGDRRGDIRYVSGANVLAVAQQQKGLNGTPGLV